MSEKQRDYIVGWISPTNRPEGKETQLDEKLPSSVRIVSLSLNFTRGTEEEFGASMPAYESKVAELAAMKADLVIPGGAPPFMLLGFEGEKRMIGGWEKKYGVPMFTSGQNHVRALRTLGIHQFVGASYFPQKLNAIFARYFTEAGFGVLAMEGVAVPFSDVPKLPRAEILDHIKRMFDKHREAEAVYILGSAWRTAEMIEELEQALGVPVIHPGAARCWEIKIRLGFHEPIWGYGRLLAQMPEGQSVAAR